MGSYPTTTSSIAGACRGVIIYLLTMLICLRASLLSSQSVCGLCGTEPPTTHHRGLWMASSDARHPRCGPADPTAQPKGPQRHNSPSAMLEAARLGSARRRIHSQACSSRNPKQPDRTIMFVTASVPTPKSTKPKLPVQSQRTRPLTT